MSFRKECHVQATVTVQIVKVGKRKVTIRMPDGREVTLYAGDTLEILSRFDIQA